MAVHPLVKGKPVRQQVSKEEWAKRVDLAAGISDFEPTELGLTYLSGLRTPTAQDQEKLAPSSTPSWRAKRDGPFSLFARVKGGRGHVVGIVGEPGVGKSRLLYEFRKSLEGEHVTWLEGHCAAYGQTMPYLPLL